MKENKINFILLSTRTLLVLILGLITLNGCTAASGVAESPIVMSLAETVSEIVAAPSVPIEKASCTTKYDVKQKNRTINLEIAAKTINNMTLNPGEVFSFNEALGKLTRDKGYKSAKIFVKGKEEQGIGGGVCQVSSTLYNAADYGGMKIVERHAHSKKVFYVEEGRDAATSYGGVDLKFRNTLDCPVKIVAKANDGELTVSLEAVLS